jgi:hypothetical protein
MEERRKHSRTDINEPGLVSAGGSVMSCVVRNISPEGAAIDVENPAFVPARFRLVMANGTIVHECRVAWIQKRRIGVSFAATPQGLGAAASVDSEQNHHHACVHHPERAGRADRHIDHAPLDERTSVVDAAANAAAAISYGHDGAHGPGPVGTGHFAGTPATAIVGGQSAFRMGARDD